MREDDEEADADGANYQLEMMRCLREVNVDNNTVGWYDKTFHSIPIAVVPYDN
jgi:translation initiation factor 3 subunit H